MFLQFFGPGRLARTLSRNDWIRFIRARRSYEVSPPGTMERLRRARALGRELPPISDRQIEYDLKFLWSVLNWAVEGDSRGCQLLERHPLKGKIKPRDWPRELTPARPRLTESQYQAMREVAKNMDWRFLVALVLAHETGHRIGSIRQLRWSDWVSEEWIRWRRSNYKIGLEHETPLTPAAIDALRMARRKNPGVGDGWVFPSPKDMTRPCSRHLMRTWWKRAQRKAGLSHIRRLGWHSLRRQFASELREAPLKDLAQLGGWKDVTTILTCYLLEDREAMKQALAMRRHYGAPTPDSSRRQST